MLLVRLQIVQLWEVVDIVRLDYDLTGRVLLFVSAMVDAAYHALALMIGFDVLFLRRVFFLDCDAIEKTDALFLID